MRRILRGVAATALAVSAWLIVVHASPVARQDRRVAAVSASGRLEVRRASQQVDRLLATGELQVADTVDDAMLPWRTHQRLRQFYNGVPVFGADLTRELDDGTPVSVLGQTFQGIALDVVPSLTALDAKMLVERLTGEELGPTRLPRLVVLPKDDGSYVLAYDVQVATPDDVTRYFLDANTGEIAWKYSNLQAQAPAVGKGTGVLGDPKKVMSVLFNGSYYTNDRMRPPNIYTYDMKGDISRMLSVLNGRVTYTSTSPGWSDMATTTNNVWTDGATVDAQVYAGFTYDYYYKRMQRKGLNDRDMSMRMFVHPISLSNYATLRSQYSVYYTNAFYAGGGYMVFGEGLPANYTAGGKKWTLTSAAIDIISHELTHGVTDYSSDLIYQDESGALNEAFSDIMATSVEFYFQPRATDVVNGSGILQADYICGEDAVSLNGVAFGLRSLANPMRDGNPDHYTTRFTGTYDNGYVHANSTIASHAFFLAVEGGTNRTSGLRVQGVGPANREQIEKIFYRAFVYKLNSDATFSTARTATIQAARDLYGANSAAETAVIQAWNAVGVDVGVVPTYGGATTQPPAASRSTAVAVPRLR